MERSVAGQFLHFEAIDTTTNNRKTGDAANITPYCVIDNGTVNALSTTTITEWAVAKSGTGLYYAQPSQTETDGRNILYFALSSTPNVKCVLIPTAMNPQGFYQSLLNGGPAFGVTVTLNNDKTGYSLAVAPPTASAIASAVWAFVIEGSFTAVQYMRLFASALFGKASGLDGTNPKFRDTGDTKNRIDATTDSSGDRTNVTLDGT